MPTAPAIRFDPATGRLEGTTLPPAADLIREGVEAGLVPSQGKVLRDDGCRACALGIAAILEDPEFARPGEPKFTGDAARVLKIDQFDAYAIANGFDGKAHTPGDCRASFAYGRAALHAARLAGFPLIPGDD